MNLIRLLRADSNAFVEFLVGPERQSFIIRKDVVFEKHYFANRHLGYLRIKGDINGGQGWAIDIPSLTRIDPESFKCKSLLRNLHSYQSYPLNENLSVPDVANYLESKVFGTTCITDENRSTVFAECAETWVVADLLGMHDLQEHIVEKLCNTRPWDALQVLSLASVVFTDNEPIQLEERKMLKDMLSDYIAFQYCDIEKVHGAELITKLRERPKLAEIVHLKVAERDKPKKKKETDER